MLLSKRRPRPRRTAAVALKVVRGGRLLSLTGAIVRTSGVSSSSALRSAAPSREGDGIRISTRRRRTLGRRPVAWTTRAIRPADVFLKSDHRRAIDRWIDYFGGAVRLTPRSRPA